MGFDIHQALFIMVVTIEIRGFWNYWIWRSWKEIRLCVDKLRLDKIMKLLKYQNLGKIDLQCLILWIWRSWLPIYYNLLKLQVDFYFIAKIWLTPLNFSIYYSSSFDLLVIGHGFLRGFVTKKWPLTPCEATKSWSIEHLCIEIETCSSNRNVCDKSLKLDFSVRAYKGAKKPCEATRSWSIEHMCIEIETCNSNRNICDKSLKLDSSVRAYKGTKKMSVHEQVDLQWFCRCMGLWLNVGIIVFYGTWIWLWF